MGLISPFVQSSRRRSIHAAYRTWIVFSGVLALVKAATASWMVFPEAYALLCEFYRQDPAARGGGSRA